MNKWIPPYLHTSIPRSVSTYLSHHITSHRIASHHLTRPYRALSYHTIPYHIYIYTHIRVWLEYDSMVSECMSACMQSCQKTSYSMPRLTNCGWSQLSSPSESCRICWAKVGARNAIGTQRSQEHGPPAPPGPVRPRTHGLCAGQPEI